MLGGIFYLAILGPIIGILFAITSLMQHDKKKRKKLLQRSLYIGLAGIVLLAILFIGGLVWLLLAVVLHQFGIRIPVPLN